MSLAMRDFDGKINSYILAVSFLGEMFDGIEIKVIVD